MRTFMTHIIKLWYAITGIKNGECEYKIDRTDLDHLLSADISHIDGEKEQDVVNG